MHFRLLSAPSGMLGSRSEAAVEVEVVVEREKGMLEVEKAK